jgi:TolB-like protein/Tfp pilus assembly protein PilF
VNVGSSKSPPRSCRSTEVEASLPTLCNLPPMFTDLDKDTLEIPHVLFLEIVDYFKLSIDEQFAKAEELAEIVRLSEQFRKAEAAGRLLKIGTGHGIALVFFNAPEEPAQCAMEVSRALKDNVRLRVRMGIDTGPVSGVAGVNGRTNVGAAAINMAQRVMDCGDAGHILLSHRVAEDLEQFERWRELLHDIGTFEVKHDVRLSVANLFSDEIGNPQLPSKLRAITQAMNQAIEKHRAHVRWAEIAIGLLVLGAIIAGVFFFARRPTTSPSRVLDKSIAVLPFHNLSSDPDNAFLTDGMQDEILTELAKIADLKVISRTSVLQYKSGVARSLRGIGEKLGVAYVVEGSVQRAAGKVRVKAQLIDARNDAHPWAQTYDRDLTDVFAIQSEIARAIADQLLAKLSPAEKAAIKQRPTSDLTAFDQYSRAKTLLLTTSLDMSADKILVQAIELLNGAVTRDPSFYAAYCQLVFAHDTLYSVWGDHTPARLAAGEAALQRAIELHPNAAETHLARGSHLYEVFRDYDGALSELEAARGGLPNDPRIPELTGYILRRQGKSEAGSDALEHAVALDPRNPYTLSQLSLSYMSLRRYGEEKATLQRALEITPDDVGLASSLAFVDVLWRADTRPFHQFIDRLRAERPASMADAADNWFLCALAEHDWRAAEQALTALGSNPFWTDNPVILSRNFGEGLLARAMHDEARARKAFTAARQEQEQLVRQQKDYGPPLCVLALIDAALGNKEAALQEGRRAMEVLPMEKDGFDGQMLIAYFALIAAWADEKELALQELSIAAPSPSAALITSYGVLKLSPFWESLRGDPRFEQVVAFFGLKE